MTKKKTEKNEKRKAKLRVERTRSKNKKRRKNRGASSGYLYMEKKIATYDWKLPSKAYRARTPL
ncbi:hypothetical protein ACFPU1_12845 [Thalassorhabdus alkalitolerans]|uniref:Uncharacterized protein n=1 Tax=Thalassorhabdus alkalitolerans TaxID=2282697 RepID=A0ABW0YQD2_9BACI